MAKKSLKEKLQEKREKLKSSGGGFETFVIKEGTTRFRILPPGDEKDWSIEATTFFLGQTKELGLVVSPHTFGEKCALNNAYNELSNSKSEEDRALAKRLKPGKKLFVPAIRYKDTKGKEIDKEAGVKLLVLTPNLCNQLIDYYLDDEDGGDFTDPTKGRDIKFKREGKGKMDTKYTFIMCDKSPIADKELRKQTFDPEEMLRKIMPSYKATKIKLEAFLNLSPEEDTESKPKKKKKKNKDL